MGYAVCARKGSVGWVVGMGGAERNCNQCCVCVSSVRGGEQLRVIGAEGKVHHAELCFGIQPSQYPGRLADNGDHEGTWADVVVRSQHTFIITDDEGRRKRPTPTCVHGLTLTTYSTCIPLHPIAARIFVPGRRYRPGSAVGSCTHLI